MGYTHYWRQKRAFTPAEWLRVTTEANRIVTVARKKKIKLRGSDGTGKPVVNYDVISLNGCQKSGEDCETLHLERAPQRRYRDNAKEAAEGIFNFCKTGYRPYDAVVVSILHAARTVAPDAITVSSDGGPKAITPKF